MRSAFAVRLLLVLVMLVVAALTAASVPGAAAPARADGPGDEVAFGLVSQYGGATQTVAVGGAYAYMANGNRLTVVSLADKTRPAAVGEVILPSALYAIAVMGNSLYVAAGYSGLHVVDVSDPTRPRLVGSYDNAGPGLARGVAASGQYAYVADYDGGLAVVDISNPAMPREVAVVPTEGSAQGVAVAGNFAYVSASKGITVFDVTNPVAPVKRGTLATPGTKIVGFNTPGAGIAVSGGRVYVADGLAGVVVVDVTNPDKPTVIGQGLPQNEPRSEVKPPMVFQLAVDGNFVYAASYVGGLRVFDVSDPTKPVEVAGLVTPLWAYQVHVQGGYAYVADYDGGLRIVDVGSVGAGAPPYRLSEVGAVSARGSFRGAVISGTYVYAAAGYYGLLVIDVGRPWAPVEIAACDTPGFAYGLAIQGGYAYVTDETTGLRVIDISVPSRPREVGSVDTPGSARSVAVRGNYAYVGDGIGGLRIIDVSNPAGPFEVGIATWPGMVVSGRVMPNAARLVKVDGNYAYVGDEYAGMRIVDISNPRNPVAVGVWRAQATSLTFGSGGAPAPGVFVWGTDVRGKYAYLALSYDGVGIIDVSDPSSPKEVARLATKEGAWAVSLFGSYLYVADGFKGLTVVDVSDPARPRIVGNYDTPGVAWGVSSYGQLVYVTDGVAGLSILRPVPRLTAQMSATRDGGDVVYTITLTNNSDMDIGQVFLSGLVPAGATPVAGTQTPGGAFSAGVVDSGGTGRGAVWLSNGVPANGSQGPFVYRVRADQAPIGPAYAWVHWATPSDGTAISSPVAP